MSVDSEQQTRAERSIPTPRLDLYSAVWQASVHMTDEEIVEYVKGILRDARREEES